MGLDLLLDRGHYVRRAQVHCLARRRAAGNKVRAHKIAGASRPSQNYSKRGPLGLVNAASVIIKRGSGSGVFESSTRCTLAARVSSSGCDVAMLTRVPIFTSAKNFGAASPCKR